MDLEEYLISSERWDLEVPPEVRIEGIMDEVERYPVGYGRHPEKGWFVLAAGQGPFLVWSEWTHPQGGVQEVTDFGVPTQPDPPFREALLFTLRRLQAMLQTEAKP